MKTDPEKRIQKRINKFCAMGAVETAKSEK
jgi:hypothetical protein